MNDAEPQRRADDGRIGKLVADMEAMKAAHADMQKKLEENTAVTKEVRDIVGSFKMIGAIAKWGTAVGAFLVGLYHGAQAILHK